MSISFCGAYKFRIYSDYETRYGKVNEYRKAEAILKGINPEKCNSYYTTKEEDEWAEANKDCVILRTKTGDSDDERFYRDRMLVVLTGQDAKDYKDLIERFPRVGQDRLAFSYLQTAKTAGNIDVND